VLEESVPLADIIGLTNRAFSRQSIQSDTAELDAVDVCKFEGEMGVVFIGGVSCTSCAVVGMTRPSEEVIVEKEELVELKIKEMGVEPPTAVDDTESRTVVASPISTVFDDDVMLFFVTVLLIFEEVIKLLVVVDLVELVGVNFVGGIWPKGPGLASPQVTAFASLLVELLAELEPVVVK